MNSRTSRLQMITTLLAAGTLVGGCSRDAPLTGPETTPELAIVVPSAALAAPQAGVSNAEAGDAIDDARTRLVGALGTRGRVLAATLLRLQERRQDDAAWADVTRAIEALSSTLPDEYHADLDALRLQLGITGS